MAVDIPVLIVGAGPTGLTLACELARRGISFRLIDKTDHYFAGSRGKGLQPRSMELLDNLGVIDTVLASGRFHLPFRGYEGAKIVGERDMHEGRNPTPDVPYASPLIIPQWRVEEILRNRLEEFGGRVELQTELTGFEQTGDGVTATLAHSGGTEQIHVQYLVGSDGGKSFVRHALGVGFEGETWASERMLVGDVCLDELDRDHWHSWPSEKLGWLALCPFVATKSFQFQAQIGPEEPDEPSLERFQEIVDERTGGMGIRLYNATWLSLYRANVRMVDRYRVGRVFLAGDSAHVHSPAGGQGMNTGIQDAFNLGWKLSLVLQGNATEDLLDTYEQERLPVAAWMLGVTSRLHKEWSPFRGPETLQLGINYRTSRLARDERDPGQGLRAGDRAPDAPCHDSAGKPARIFDILRGPHFTLLGFDLPEMPRMDFDGVRACTIGVDLIDTGGHAYRAYGVQPGTAVLVRPDGYIGLIAERPTTGLLNEYLKFNQA